MNKKLKGRGAGINPQNRFNGNYVAAFNNNEIEYLDSEINESKIDTEFIKDHSKSIISKNDSPDVGFTASVNPYKGCEHGCVYCYARPTHEYLGYSSGYDFESKILYKEDAPSLLEKEFLKKSYRPDVLMFSGNTDCYQPVEKKMEITKNCLQICLKYRNPVSIITKNALILRDLDIIKELAEHRLVKVTFSIATLIPELSRKLEPRTSSPQLRLKALSLLSKNNVPAGVSVAPVIPGLTDEEIPAILKAAAGCGASFAWYIMLRLPHEVKSVFLEWLQREYPLKYEKVVSKIKDMRSGKLNDSRTGIRFTGEGEYAQITASLFNVTSAKYGLNKPSPLLAVENFAGKKPNQLSLF